MEKHQNLWNNILDKLSQILDEKLFEDVFGEVKFVSKEEGNLLYIIVPNDYIKHKINSLYLKMINDIIKDFTNEKIKFKFVLENELIKSTQPTKAAFSKIKKNNLNANYSFESLVVGEANRLGYATALKVADDPGNVINPLYIFGGVGLGKTHLMQAIGNYISDNNIDANILYIQASDFIADYGKACRDKNMKEFEEKYDNLDVLLVDDIQILANGKQSQQEFFTLFNDLINEHKQIVITSDCPANKLTNIMDRLTSRFLQGMTVDIKQPDLNQRINILKKKLEENYGKKINDDILLYIAENFTDNVRELEGGLNRVMMCAEIYNVEPTLQLAKESLELLLKNRDPKRNNNNYEQALSVISDIYNITTADLYGTSRNSKYVQPRHIAMYILKTNYNLTYAKIGYIFNGRDHTTVMNACKKIESEIETDEKLKMAINSILKKI